MERLTEKQRHILQQKLCDMKRRCYNPEEKFYKDYGGRGIKVCDEWMDKKEGHGNFQKWAVENGWEEGRSIDRIDVNGNYKAMNKIRESVFTGSPFCVYIFQFSLHFLIDFPYMLVVLLEDMP